MRERETTIPSSESFDIAKTVKETYSYVCPDLAKEFKKYDEVCLNFFFFFCINSKQKNGY